MFPSSGIILFATIAIVGLTSCGIFSDPDEVVLEDTSIPQIDLGSGDTGSGGDADAAPPRPDYFELASSTVDCARPTEFIHIADTARALSSVAIGRPPLDDGQRLGEVSVAWVSVDDGDATVGFQVLDRELQPLHSGEIETRVGSGTVPVASWVNSPAIGPQDDPVVEFVMASQNGVYACRFSGPQAMAQWDGTCASADAFNELLARRNVTELQTTDVQAIIENGMVVPKFVIAFGGRRDDAWGLNAAFTSSPTSSDPLGLPQDIENAQSGLARLIFGTAPWTRGYPAILAATRTDEGSVVRILGAREDLLGYEVHEVLSSPPSAVQLQPDEFDLLANIDAVHAGSPDTFDLNASSIETAWAAIDRGAALWFGRQNGFGNENLGRAVLPLEGHTIESIRGFDDTALSHPEWLLVQSRKDERSHVSIAAWDFQFDVVVNGPLESSGWDNIRATSASTEPPGSVVALIAERGDTHGVHVAVLRTDIPCPR